MMSIQATRALAIIGLSIISAALLMALPAVTSAAVEKTDGFVCPVIKTSAVLNSPRGAAIGGGHYTIIGPNVSVPMHATNNDGAGTPGGPHAMPGDPNYSAIWANQ